jgi:trehalose-6-phosphatase
VTQGPEKLSRDQFFASLERSLQAVLLLDYDGTLAPFHTDPSRAVPYPGVVSLLLEIMRGGRTRVVFVSGRRAADWLHANDLRELAEFKPGTIAVHWRDRDQEQAEAIRRIVLEGWTPIVQRTGMTLEDFDGGLELRLSGRDKGDVVRFIVDETAPGVPIAFLGNDAPDEEAFRALSGSGLGVLVSPEPRPSAASLWIRPPGELLQFLEQWLAARQAMEASASSGGRPSSWPGTVEPEAKR